MTKEMLLQYCGSLEQVASVRPVTYEDGRAGGMRAILVKNGPLEYSLMQDKCLDMASLSYRGINLAMLTKPLPLPLLQAGQQTCRSISPDQNRQLLSFLQQEQLRYRHG